ncbi:2TM domain-containing protein [Robiginitalea sp.]|uniref:2TM domain-containing protein n=1 Tax=Robiginitalea sp. TaxID=1902411 RepID=UPI003C763B63
MENFDIIDKRKRAKKRVDELKGFYIHLLVYLIINTFLIVVIFMSQADNGSFTLHWYNFSTAIFWGLGLLIHAMVTFRLNPFFGKSWENRMIQKYMDEDRKESERFK